MKGSQTVSIFSTHTQAEKAVKLLTEKGIDIKSLSILGKGYHSEQDITGFYNTGDRVQTWGKFGVFWGGLWGLLVGSAFFIIPGVGPIAAAGPIVSTFVGGVEGAVLGGGVNALVATLISIGIPKDSVLKYETSIKADNFLLIYHGEDIDKVKEIIKPLTKDIITHHN